MSSLCWNVRCILIRSSGDVWTTCCTVKLLHERDALTVYRHTIHPDRKQEVTVDPDYWTEEGFLRYMDQFYFTVDPILRVFSTGPQPPLPDAALRPVYVGDPSGRKEYPQK